MPESVDFAFAVARAERAEQIVLLRDAMHDLETVIGAEAPTDRNAEMADALSLVQMYADRALVAAEKVERLAPPGSATPKPSTSTTASPASTKGDET